MIPLIVLFGYFAFLYWANNTKTNRRWEQTWKESWKELEDEERTP